MQAEIIPFCSSLLAEARGSFLFGFLACLVIAALWICIWFAQLKILFDDEKQELISKLMTRDA